MGLSRVSAAGGEPLRVTALDSSRHETSHRQPEFLPDGRHFLFVARSEGFRAEGGIFIGDIQAKPEPNNVRRLMGGDMHVSYVPPGYLLFLRNDDLMAQTFDARRLELTSEPFLVTNHVAAERYLGTSDFSVSANGVLAWRTQSASMRQLAWFDRIGKQSPGLDAREQYIDPSLSPDGRWIAVTKLSAPIGPYLNGRPPGTHNIWLLDLVRGTASRLTFATGRQWMPTWSPDGRRVVFGQDQDKDKDRPLAYGLYWRDTNGAGAEEVLLKTTQFSYPSDWSRDGWFILFTEVDSKTYFDMWVLPLFGDRKPIPLLQTEFAEGQGAFSPDGHWIAYFSDETGRMEIYVRSFPEGETGIKPGKWRVSTAGGVQPRWRRDGKELFFNTPDGKLMAVGVKTGSTFEPGVPVELFDTRDPSENFGFDVSPDGQRFLVNRAIEVDQAQPVNISTNWLAGMKK